MTINELRRARGWSARELAERADLALGTLGDIEHQDRPKTRLETMRKLAAAFGWPTHTLIAVLDDAQAPPPVQRAA